MRWRTFDLDALPERPGCYAVYCDGELVYIGQSLNVRQRVRAHGIDYARYSNWFTTPWGGFRYVVVKVRSSQRRGDWLMHEYRLIDRLCPRFNRLHAAV